MAWVVWWRQRHNHRDLSPLFWRSILFIHGGFHYRRQVKSDQRGLYWLFYVFTLTEINNSRNIVGRLLMRWLTSMFSSFSLTYKNSKLAAQILKAVKTSFPLRLPGWTFWRLVCQSISCPSFWVKKRKIDFYQFTVTQLPLSWYTRLKKSE